MKFILGKKQKMTQIFDENGTVKPATLVLAAPNKVILVRTKEKDGYEAVQIAVNNTKKEFRLADAGYKIGDVVEVGLFSEGDTVTVSGITKGKGFQGVVKRHGFHGGSRTHGQKHSEREGGSIGGTAPQRVLKGTRMPGRMGGVRVTVKKLKILQVNRENNEILISGAVPGRKGTLLEITSK